MFEKEADNYADRYVTEGVDELKRKVIKGHWKDGAEFGYNKGYRDAEEHYMNVIDGQHKLVDKSKKKAKEIIGRILSDSEIWQYKCCMTKELFVEAEQFLKECEE